MTEPLWRCRDCGDKTDDTSAGVLRDFVAGTHTCRACYREPARDPDQAREDRAEALFPEDDR